MMKHPVGAWPIRQYVNTVHEYDARMQVVREARMRPSLRSKIEFAAGLVPLDDAPATCATSPVLLALGLDDIDALFGMR